MQITKNFFSKTVLSIALISISNLTFADNSTSQQESNITNGMRVLLQESGGLRYSPKNCIQNIIQWKMQMGEIILF